MRYAFFSSRQSYMKLVRPTVVNEVTGVCNPIRSSVTYIYIFKRLANWLGIRTCYSMNVHAHLALLWSADVSIIVVSFFAKNLSFHPINTWPELFF